MDEIKDLEDFRKNAEDSDFQPVHMENEEVRMQKEVTFGEAVPQEMPHDHTHGEGHVPPHTHGDSCSCDHEHHHEHNHEHCHEHNHEHSHEHHHNHEHEHEHEQEHNHEHAVPYIHSHTHTQFHHVEGHPENCECERCHPHEEYCDVCGESLAHCHCVMPDATNIKKVYILQNLECSICAAKMEYKIKQLPTVSYASVSALTQQLRISAKDPDRLVPLIQAIVTEIDSSVRVIPHDTKPGMAGKYRIYDIEGLDCAGCAAKVEDAIAALPEVKEAVLVYATGQLRIASDNFTGLTEKMQQAADQVEEGVAIIAREGASAKMRTYEVRNLNCAVCANRIEDAINDLPEVEEAVLTYATGLLRVKARSYDGLLEKLQNTADGIEEGLLLVERSEKPVKAAPGKGEESSFALTADQQELLEVVFGGAIFIAAEWLGLIPQEYHLYALIASYAILGWRILGTAFRNMLKGEFFDENFLMTVATLGAFAIQAWEEAVGVIFFYRIGEWLQDKAAERSRRQIMETADMRPEVVNLLIGEEVRVIPSEEARVGDILLVRAGDRIPLDGVVIDGESLLDTSPITGEPVPVRKKYGDEVLSGCVNTSAMLKIRVEKELQESMVSKILDSVENAAANKPHIDRFITRFARRYTPIVVALAIAVAVIPSLLTGNWNYWVYTALTFLVISCPCALVLSVPLAFFAGIGAGSRLGILFKGGNAMELLKHVSAVVMDKTGTVTKGNFVLQKVTAMANVSPDEILQLTAGAEQASTHPIALSIVAAAREKGLSLPHPDYFEEIAGAGLAAHFGNDLLLVGNTRLLNRYQVRYEGYQAAHSGSEVLVARNGVFLGTLLINDTLKDDAIEAITALKKEGLAAVMLTGDTQQEATAMAKAAGIQEVLAELLPQDKLREMNALRNKYGGVMFVGDGINDAPVLAGADVGAAMGSGADAAIEAADVVFMNSEMSSIPKAIAIARTVTHVAWQNVVFALVVKIIIMAAGILGYASMWAAVFADTGVSVICVLNTCRILYKKF